MSAHSETLARLVEQGYTAEQAESILAVALASGEVRRARERAVERLIRIHRPEYRRLFAQERGHVPGSAEVDGRCEICDEVYSSGTEIRAVDDKSWVHAECLDDQERP